MKCTVCVCSGQYSRQIRHTYAIRLTPSSLHAYSTRPNWFSEFCWTIFGLFDAINVPYKAINIDSFEYAKDNQGNKYRL
jgi:hypothetical protein